MTTESGKAADTMKFTEIDGVRIVHEFVVLWHEWECDGYGWVTEDGRVYLSTHGNIFEAPTSEVLERLEAALSCADGIRKALALASHRGAGERRDGAPRGQVVDRDEHEDDTAAAR